ncbi:glycosyltransferase [Sesbania bispinosa]|nr:glycosyltransferase [Sesbania bispinosa]
MSPSLQAATPLLLPFPLRGCSPYPLLLPAPFVDHGGKRETLMARRRKIQKVPSYHKVSSLFTLGGLLPRAETTWVLSSFWWLWRGGQEALIVAVRRSRWW